MATTLISLDIETECALWTSCEDTQCKHALDPYKSAITVTGLYYYENGVPKKETYRHIGELRDKLNSMEDIAFVGHNFKFDLHHLLTHGLDLRHHPWWDTQVLASVCLDRIPDAWLNRYEAKRLEENKKLPYGVSHRRAGKNSLKTLAPYFLGVEPFWENPANHDNDEYVLKDCDYTYSLYTHLKQKVEHEFSWAFYEKLMEWTHMLLGAEVKGITLDQDEVWKQTIAAKKGGEEAKKELDEMWNAAYQAYYDMQRGNLWCAYAEKMERAVAKLKHPTAQKIGKTKKRYEELYDKSLSKMDTELNLDSPKQLTWLLKDYLGLDITTYDGEESTGREVLERLAATGREDVQVFLKYRKNRKLSTSFFPTYQELQHNDVLHCTFNPTGTRTGRLSSYQPNLQQVPSDLHKIFKARPGYKLATFDMSAIEPALIAFYSQDTTLCNILIGGLNFHSYITDLIFPNIDCPLDEVKHHYPKERAFAKEFDLSKFYGSSTRRIQASSAKHGFNFEYDECQQINDVFNETFHEYFEWKRDLDARLKGGEVFKNLVGRPIKIAPRDVHMKGVNTLIQSSASDLVLNSASNIQKKLDEVGAQVLLLVHDEIVTEIPEKYEDYCVEIIKQEMTNYSLTTAHGPVRLSVEGKVAMTWEK